MKRRPTNSKNLICFHGYVSKTGYTWEKRNDGLAPGSPGYIGSILDQEFEGDYIVPNGTDQIEFTLEFSGGRTRLFMAGRTEKCFPLFDLVNAVIDESREYNMAIEFVERYGMPNGWHEISLQEFQRIAFGYLNTLKGIRDYPDARWQIPNVNFDEVQNENAYRIKQARSFKGFCLLTLRHLVEARREVRQCDFCARWYVLAHRSGKGRGGHGGDTLRFCPYGSCRQKSKATTAGYH